MLMPLEVNMADIALVTDAPDLKPLLRPSYRYLLIALWALTFGKLRETPTAMVVEGDMQSIRKFRIGRDSGFPALTLCRMVWVFHVLHV